MKHILLTGAAGNLGRLLVKQLSAAGYTVRGMGRRAKPADWTGAEWQQADLATGVGLTEAVQGIDVVLHAATGGNNQTQQTDVEGTRRLLEASRAAHVSHIIYVSIVGVDVVPYPVGEAKLAGEKLIQQGGVPWSILRATQFHYLIDTVLQFLTKLPLVAFVPTDLLIQPIAAEDVARRLVEIAEVGPSGRVPDMGGPKVYTGKDLAQSWLKQRGMRRIILPLWLPGKTASSIRQGGNTCPQQATGKLSWEAWLKQHYSQQA
jgi:uncharacterized protein YbjT (DUF2867 family)